MSRAIVTTSWDDGHKLDLRLAELLHTYNLPATFYIAPQNEEIAKENLLTEAQVRELSNSFEIGSHTMTHPSLDRISAIQVTEELETSKRYLTDVIGKEVTSFCYPRGHYDKAVAKAVEQAGYTYARTVERFHTERTFAPFEAPTALEAHRGPIPRFAQDLMTLAKINRYNPVATLRCLDWEVLAKLQFDHAVASGGIYHFWGHSWVVEQFGDWERLERVLAYIAGHNDVDYCTNGELKGKTS
jgi:peptidoglycan-N-acetylglucosamine deacetylase